MDGWRCSVEYVVVLEVRYGVFDYVCVGGAYVCLCVIVQCLG